MPPERRGARALVVSCEHASASVPPRWRPLFRGAERALASHRGSDLGALPLARALARGTGAPLVAARASRLLVDANRSLGHPRLFSEWTRGLSADERARLVARFWRPQREAVERAVRARLGGAPVLHLGVHSFTPRWKGAPREVDVALLYDPARPRERAFAARFLAALSAAAPELRLRRNFPYRGTADGLTTSLRRALPARSYLGIELEVSQAFPLGAAERWSTLRRTLVRVLRHALCP